MIRVTGVERLLGGHQTEKRTGKRMRKFTAMAAVLVLLLIAGCAAGGQMGSVSPGREPIKVEVSRGKGDTRPDEPSAKEKEAAEASETPQMRRLSPYAPEAEPERRREREKARFSTEKKVSVAVDGMTLEEFIPYVFSDVFDRDFVIDPSISERELEKPVTLSLKKEVTENRFFEIVTDVLAGYNISVAAKEGLFYLGKETGGKHQAVGIGALPEDVPKAAGKIVQLVPIKYMDATNLLSFLPKSGNVGMQLARGENMIIFRGEQADIQTALEMIRVLDRPAMRGRYIGSCELEHLKAQVAVEQIKKLLREEGVPIAPNAGGRGVYLLSLENRGILIYFAAEQHWLSRLEYWIETIDKPKKTGEKQYHVYFPKNCRAASLFDSVKTLISGGSQRISSAQRKPTEERPAEESRGAGDTKSAQMSVEGENIKLSVDKIRNALIVYSTQEQYARIAQLLEKLDLMPVQVLLEASVVEVTLTDQLQYGLEWYLKGSGGSERHILKTQGGLGLGSGGLDFSLVADSEDFQMAINAMMKKDIVEILSNPRVTVRDGKTANIMVGTEVPVITSEAVSADAVTEGSSDTIRSVQYRSTGVTLNVTPMVHSEGIVTLEITQEVSEAQSNTTSDISSPIILNRSITTEVAASDGQTILLGGLIKENKSDTVTQVPWLGNIPFLGHLFKTTSRGGDRTELVIMITPRIIRNRQEIEELRDVIFERLSSIELQ